MGGGILYPGTLGGLHQQCLGFGENFGIRRHPLRPPLQVNAFPGVDPLRGAFRVLLDDLGGGWELLFDQLLGLDVWYGAFGGLNVHETEVVKLTDEECWKTARSLNLKYTMRLRYHTTISRVPFNDTGILHVPLQTLYRRVIYYTHGNGLRALDDRRHDVISGSYFPRGPGDFRDKVP